MKFEKPAPKPSTETMTGPWRAVVRISDKDGATVADAGDTVPDGLVKKNRWLVSGGKVVGKPKPKKSGKG